tara:strand:- start:234 stop:1442 length:1209 start_codon:yes stop_codon:yes gene_type:complete
MNKLKTTNRGGKLFANANDIEYNPMNPKLYTDKKVEEAKAKEIAKTYIDRVDRGLTPNEQPIMIYKNDIMAQVGNTRTWGGRIANVPVWVVFSEVEKPDFKSNPYDALMDLKTSNIFRAPTYRTKVDAVIELNKSYMNQFGVERPADVKEEHRKEMKIAKKTLKQLLEINTKKPELIKEIDEGNYSVQKAYDEATGKLTVKVTGSTNPNQDWSPIYTNEFFTRCFNRVGNFIQKTFDLNCTIGSDDFYPFPNFATPSISSLISYLCEQVGSAILLDDGYDVKAATGNRKDADITHNDVGDKVEIKVTGFKGTATTWSGGRGIREGQYILVTYDELAQNWLIIFTSLTKADWIIAGIETRLPIKKVYNNHKDDKDFRIVCGDIKMMKNNVYPQIEPLTSIAGK